MDAHRARRVPLRLAFTIVLLAGLAIRLAVLPFHGHTYDMQTFLGWAHLLMRFGPQGLYQHVEPFSGHHVNYPPAYGLILMLVVSAYQLLHVVDPQQRLFWVALKLPATIADLAICLMIFALVRRWFGERAAVGAAALAAATPAMWLVSSYWGQVDAISAAFTLLALWAAIRGRSIGAWICLALAVLVKPQPIVIAPLLLLWEFRERGPSWRLVAGPLAAGVVAYLTSLPFAPSHDPGQVALWLTNLLQLGVGMFPRTSIGAYNLYTITGWFGTSDVLPLFGLSLRTWGEIAFAALLAFVMVVLYRRLALDADARSRERTLFLACFIVLAALFELLTRMHERYLFWAVALAPLLWYAGRWQRAVAATMSAAFILNCAFVLFNVADVYEWRVAILVHAISLASALALAIVVYQFGAGTSLLKPGRRIWAHTRSAS